MESVKITKRAVDALKATGRRYTAWDTDISGFGVRVGPGGSKTYVLKYRVGGGRAGRVRWGVIGQHGALTPDQAREIARRWTHEVAAGGDPAGDKLDRRKEPTVAELMDEYLKRHVRVKNKPATVASVSDWVERIIKKDPIARRKVSDVGTPDVSRLHARLSDTPTQANRVRSVLSKAFALAETWGWRGRASNPCLDVQKNPERAKERYLSPPELQALGEVLAQAKETGAVKLTEKDAATGKETVRLRRISPAVVAAIRLLLFTGARRGEILTLRWEYIDFQAGHASLPDSKTGKKRIILVPAALEVLRGLNMPENDRGYVIRGGDGSNPEIPLINIKDPWGVIRIAAGLPDVRLHDLRHTFASVMVSDGMSLPVLGALLGHRSTLTTQRYAHLSSDPVRDAASRISATLAAHVDGKNGGAQIIPLRRM